MPELPEVEIARRNLTRWLRGARITTARASDRLVVRGTPGAFASALRGRKVVAVARRGKRLRIELDDGARVFSHLGMSGGWVRRAAGAPPERFERARLDVTHGGRASSVRYVDARRLGRLVVAHEDIPAWRALGPDALDDEGLDVRRLAAALAKKRRNVKEALMDQSVLAGVGNIQAIEALWRARIDPRTPTAALRPAHVRAIADGIRASIAHTIAAALGPELAYVNAGGKNPFAIYGRAGSPCPRCATKLARIVLGGRGTTFCPGCQVRLALRAPLRAAPSRARRPRPRPSSTRRPPAPSRTPSTTPGRSSRRASARRRAALPPS